MKKFVAWIKSAAGIVSICLLIVSIVLLLLACSSWGCFSERTADCINNILFGIGTNLIGIIITVSFVQFFLDRQSTKIERGDECDKILRSDRVMRILIRDFIIYFNTIVTPMTQRGQMSTSEFREFFSFSDMRDLYLEAPFTRNKLYEPAIISFYDAELKLREYCIELITKYEFKYNPNLLNTITQFVEVSMSYDVRSAVLGNTSIVVGDGKTKFIDVICKNIADTSTDWVSIIHKEKSHANIMAPYVCLYDLLIIEKQLISQYMIIVT